LGLYVHHPSSLEHDTGTHPENAGRIRALEAALEAAGWCGLDRFEAPAATRDQLHRVHTPRYVDAIEAFSAAGGGLIDADTMVSERSFEAAVRSAGGAAWAAERLLAGEDRFAFSALRPPGHHAEAAQAMGFCLFNSAAVAASHAVAACGAERVLILDWDVHHGNGTEAIFAASTEVLYVSIHQWPLYPGTGAALDEGEAGAEGYTINLPVPAGSGSEEFRALVQHIVAPVARDFRPALLIISAGFDAHRDDPLADCLVDDDGYGDMAASIRELGAELEAPVLVCLEGGYDPAALARSAIKVVEALGGDRVPLPAPAQAAAPHVERVAARWPGVGV
jgi:acetoin utilization deacetylase AcuC-like enzyme